MADIPQVPSGWLAPDGTVYEAGFQLHNETAVYIVTEVLGEEEPDAYAGCMTRLYDLGYIRLDIHSVYGADGHPTPAQLEKLRAWTTDAYGHGLVTRKALLEYLYPKRWDEVGKLVEPGRRKKE